MDAYRDELEAAIARAESAESALHEAERAATADRAEIARLQREVEELNAEVKRLRKQVKKASDDEPEREAERSKPEKPRADRQQSGRGRAVLTSIMASGWVQGTGVAAVLVGLVVGIIAVQSSCQSKAALSASGELQQMVRTQLADGRSVDVFLVERYGEDGRTSRVVVVDSSSWSEVVRRVPSKRALLGIAAAAPGRLWLFPGNDRVELRDTSTLEVVATYDQIVSRSPALKAAGVHDLERAHDGRLVFTAKDGQRFVVDAVSLGMEPYTGETESATSHSQPEACQWELVGRKGLRYSTKEIDGGPRSSVTISSSSRDDERVVEPSLLHPKPCLIDEGAHALVVVHTATLDTDSKVLVSRLDLEGKLVWTLELAPRSELAWVERQGDQLIVGVNEPVAQFLVLDWATGQIVRRSRL